MPDTEKDNTLSEHSIGRLLGSQGLGIAKNGDSRQSPQTTGPEHQDYAQVGAEETAGQTPAEQLGPEIRNACVALRPGLGLTSQRAKILLVAVLSVVLLVVLNRFHGVPAFESRWLRLAAYRTILGDFVELGALATDGWTKKPVRLTVMGIVYNQDRPSAIIGSAIAHQGDKVSGATVVKISRDSIEFEANGVTWMQRVQ